MRYHAATLVATLSLLLGAVTVGAEEIVIGAGSDAGEYTNTIVPAIDKALTEANSGVTAKAQVSPGSQANLDKLLAGELKAALVQLDVLALNIDKASEAGLRLVDVIAPEALLCVARVDGRVRSYYNLNDEKLSQKLVVSIGAAGSGPAHTVPYVLSMDPDFNADNIDFVYEGNTEAELDRLAGGSRDLVCFVMLANPKNPLIEKVAENKELHFIDFVSAYALQADAGGAQVYEAMVVPVSSGLWGFRAAKVQTLVTWVGLVVGPGLDDKSVEALRLALSKPDLLPPTTMTAKAKQLFSDYKDKAKAWAIKAKDTTVEYTQKAKEKAVELKDKAVEKAGELTNQNQ